MIMVCVEPKATFATLAGLQPLANPSERPYVQ